MNRRQSIRTFAAIACCFISATAFGVMSISLPSLAKDTLDKSLDKEITQIEMQVVGKTPQHESSEQRLQSIEIKLFGQPQSGTLFDRLSKIRQGLISASNANDGVNKADAWPGFPSGTGASTIPASLPVSLVQTAATPPSEGLTEDGWPTALPRVIDGGDKRAPLKAEVETTGTSDDELVKSLKTAPVDQVAQRANEALDNGKYSLAQRLFAMLSIRKPRDPRYFYGAGMAYKLSGDYQNAFADLIMSWHLGSAPVYDQAVSSLIPALQKSIDDTFKVTYDHQASDPEAVLNAGVRMWKSNMTPQSVKLFEYVLKNEPLYRGDAAYNLGAVAERNGDVKLALEYYKWAANENHRLQGVAQHNPELAGSINKSLNLVPADYIEKAVADMQQRVLRGHAAEWNGWSQASVRPQHWASEVCPLCAISRTSLEYKPGQMSLE